MAQQLSTFVATVARVNDKGCKIAEGDRWPTWSRFAGDHTAPPHRRQGESHGARPRVRPARRGCAGDASGNHDGDTAPATPSAL
jgi:hypothetical protein